MLYLNIPGGEFFDENTLTFTELKPSKIQMEHSLVSLSKWESKWKKPFLSEDHPKTNEEVFDYFRCMTITQNVDPDIFKTFSKDIIRQIEEYIDDPMTATWFNDRNTPHGPKTSEVITAEILYYDMIALNIPFECQKWHLNRLLTLIRVCSIKSQPAKKMSQKDILNQNRALNAARRAKSKSKG